VPESDPNSEEEAREDAAWRDLIARFDAPPSTQEPAPWPDREEMTPAPHGTTAAPAPGTATDSGGPQAGGAGSAGTKPAEAGSASVWRPAVKHHEDTEHHYVPPPPPPLPKLDPLSKLAWLALFGGPGYLLVATAAQWSMPGLFVFIAVAAFVAGVALLVFRLNDSDRDDSDDDNGAVV
jgi:hypothetical protein